MSSDHDGRRGCVTCDWFTKPVKGLFQDACPGYEPSVDMECANWVPYDEDGGLPAAQHPDGGG
jgi:hypothetical protein